MFTTYNLVFFLYLQIMTNALDQDLMTDTGIVMIIVSVLVNTEKTTIEEIATTDTIVMKEM